MTLPREKTRQPIRWRRRLILCALAILILRLGLQVDRRFCVACEQREIDLRFFGLTLFHRVVTPPVFPVARYPESEAGCRAGQHRRSNV